MPLPHLTTPPNPPDLPPAYEHRRASAAWLDVEQLPPYSAHPNFVAQRTKNIHSALRLLRLAPGQHKPAALARHLALFEKLVARLEAEGVPLSPLERGWALVTSCPGLALLDVWFHICDRPEVGEEAWTALVTAYARAEPCPSKPGHVDRTRRVWRSLLGM